MSFPPNGCFQDHARSGRRAVEDRVPSVVQEHRVGRVGMELVEALSDRGSVLRDTVEVLQPYFKLRKAAGSTFYRSDKKLRAQPPLDLSQLH